MTTDARAIRPTVLLATSNGTGMGHLARQVSVAMALREQVDPVVFSLSSAAPVIRTHGIRGEYCPSYQCGWMPHDRWHGYLRERLRALVAETGTGVLVFDGVAPYPGLLRARLDLPDVAFVWSRRALWRPGVNLAALHCRDLFDLVIEPGDIAAAADRGATARLDDALRIPPVTLLEHLDPLPRDDAARALGLDPSRPTALVTLSSGVLNDVATPGTAAVSGFLADPGWQVAVTRSAITRGGVPLADRERAIELRGVYPLARYLSAFDAAVAAGGYNSFHEMLYAGIPTLFVPNASSSTDDQVARARWAAEHALALVAEESSPADVALHAARLRDPGVRADLRAACAELPRPNGSAVAARALTELAGTWAGPRTGLTWRRWSQGARVLATSALGPRGTAAARRALGRPAAAGPLSPIAVRLVEDQTTGHPTAHRQETVGELPPALLTQRLDPGLLSAGYPVEHLLPASSAAYLQQRRRIARRYYDVRSEE